MSTSLNFVPLLPGLPYPGPEPEAPFILDGKLSRLLSDAILRLWGFKGPHRSLYGQALRSRELRIQFVCQHGPVLGSQAGRDSSREEVLVKSPLRSQEPTGSEGGQGQILQTRTDYIETEQKRQM